MGELIAVALVAGIVSYALGHLYGWQAGYAASERETRKVDAWLKVLESTRRKDA